MSNASKTKDFASRALNVSQYLPGSILEVNEIERVVRSLWVPYQPRLFRGMEKDREGSVGLDFACNDELRTGVRANTQRESDRSSVRRLSPGTFQSPTVA